MGALISDCQQYRYWLTRPSETSNPGASRAFFVMLNPSTADANLDDPTIRRCRGFAKAWDCAGLTVANLYALRSKDPMDLWKHQDPVGPENDDYLERLAREHGDIVCAWGTNADHRRVAEFVRIYERLKPRGVRLWCLGVSKSGAPRHPLYIRADQPLLRYEPAVLSGLKPGGAS